MHADDFFGREAELSLLAECVADGNHVLLTGQRRMGKTSLARELGRRLEGNGWLFFFVDVEEAAHPEDVVALVSQQVHSVRPLASKFASTMVRLAANVEEVSAYEFRLKVRAGLDAGNWRRHGEGLFDACAAEPKPVLIVLDELPIFLLTLLRSEDDLERGRKRVDEFLTWLRAVQQRVAGRGLTFVASGSIGLVPLASRLGIPDRINHLYTFRLQPWSRDASVGCLLNLAASHCLTVQPDVAAAVVDKLGIGIPHHIQSFFAHLREDAMMHGRGELLLEAVDRVYHSSLLAPWGQTDLMHYDTRLRDAFDERSHRIALEILTEAATQGTLTPKARDRFEAQLAALGDQTQGRITGVLDVLVHDGYLGLHDDGYVFQSRLLRDWWIVRFGRGHEPFEERAATTAGVER